MVEIKKVETKGQIKKFVRFSEKIYQGNPFYVPPIQFDEMNLANPRKNASFDDCDMVSFLAVKDGKIAGRIMGIISHLYNKKNNEKRVRFSRFECINDQTVANALFDAVETWAKEKGMETIHGPLGFNDLEREGLMVFGFDTIGTFQGSYNPEYYQKLVEAYGYEPEARWVEWRMHVPEKIPERVERVANAIEKRYGFYEKRFKSIKQIIKQYRREFFRLLDLCFENIYATVPFTEKLIKQTISLFNLVLDRDYITLIFNKNDEIIAFGLGYASLAKAMNKSKGRFLPFGIFRIFHAIKFPKTLELGLIGVHPDYQKMGVPALIINNMMQRIYKNGIKVCETGLQLETNIPVLSVFEMFDRELVRKKVCYVKKLK